MNNNEFKIVIKIKDYIKVIDNYIVNIPKKELYLKNRIYNYSFDLLEEVYQMNNTKEFINNKLKSKISMLDYLFEYLYIKKYISEKQLEKIIFKLIEINKMISSWGTNKEIRKNVKNKNRIYNFEKNKMEYIYYAKYLLENKLYNGGTYNVFIITKPKVRVIMSMNMIDKLINHYITKTILIKKLNKYLIDENVVTRKNMGLNLAMKKLKYGIEKHKKYKEFYFLKIDISKYFYSIDHKILKNLLHEKLDAEEYILMAKIIDSTDKEYINKIIKKYEDKYKNILPKYEPGKGLSIGNMTSQFLAIFYLYKLHYYIKHNLKIKHFIIYMDDYVLIHQNKEYLKYCLKKIVEILKDYKLKINENKTYIVNAKHGIPFLGYNIKVKNKKTIITMNRNSVNNIKNGVKRAEYLYNNGCISTSVYFSSLMNYKNAYNFANNKKNCDIIDYIG